MQLTFVLNPVEKGLVLVGCVALCAFLSCALSVKQKTEQSAKTVTPLNPEEKIAQIGKDATVILVGKADDETGGYGTGFFVRRNLIVTNIHIVAGIHGKSYNWSVNLLNQPTQYTIKGGIASDPKRDLVILKVEGEEVGVLPLGDSDKVELGEEVIAVGASPQRDNEAKSKIANGTISRIAADFFRMKASLLPGYSGGPVLNDKGEVIGVSVEGGKARNSGAVVPSNHIKILLNNMLAQEKPLEKWQEEPLIHAYAYANQGDAKKELDGDYKGAIKAYDTAIHLNPDFAGVYLKRGLVKSNLADYKGAIEDYNAVIHLGKDYSDVYSNRGVAKKGLGDYKGAIEDYDKAIHLEPDYADAYVNRGLAKKDLGDYKGAIKDCDTAIRLKPEDAIVLATAYGIRADAKSGLGNTKGAIEDYDEAIRLKPGNAILATVYVKRADAKSDVGDSKGAVEDYNEAIRLKPGNAILAAAYVNRGLGKTELGDTKGAIEDYDEAIRLKPRNATLATAYVNRADAKSHLGDAKGAIEDYDEAIRLNPKNTAFAVYVYRRRSSGSYA